MPRHALGQLIRRWILAAALPVAGSGCTPSQSTCGPDIEMIWSANVLFDRDGSGWPDQNGAQPIEECRILCGDAGTTGPFLDGSAVTLERCEIVLRAAPEMGVPAERSLVCNVSGIVVDLVGCGGGGRRPRGLAEAVATEGGDVTGKALAAIAHLEAASVEAFAILEAELIAHGAPEGLVRAARSAARDEVSHAVVMESLAARHGASMARVVIAPKEPRGLVDLAIENAIEGCVGETWGACVAAYQADAARDPEVARAMQRIAVDEARHGDLAWAVDEWVRPLLDDAGRQRVADAHAAALAQLERDIEHPIDDTVQRALGLPPIQIARRLVASMKCELAA